MEANVAGIIAACAVCAFFGIIIAVIIGCYCGKRSQKKKDKEEQKSAIQAWSKNVSPLVASESAYSEGYHKLGTYQPRILAKSISKEHLVAAAENATRRSSHAGSEDFRRVRRYSSASDIRMTEVEGKNISVVDIKGHNEGYYSQYSAFHNGGFVVPGYMIGSHIYPENPTRRSVVREGQIVVGHQVHGAASNRSSTHVYKQNVSVGNSGQVVSTIKQTETPLSVQSSDISQTQYTVTESSYADRPRGLITPIERHVDEDVSTSVNVENGVTTVIEESSSTVISPVTSTTTEIIEETSTTVLNPVTTTTTTVVTEDWTVTPTQVVTVEETQEIEEEQVTPRSQKIEQIVVGQGAMTNVKIFSETTGESSVTKTYQTDIAREPRWMETQFEENSRSLTFDDDEGIQQSALGTDFVETYGAVRVVSTGGASASQTDQMVVSNTSQEEEYVIEDYVDPDPPVIRSVVQHGISAQTSGFSTEGESSATRTITTVTREVTTTGHQTVEQSASQVVSGHQTVEQSASQVVSGHQTVEQSASQVVSGHQSIEQSASQVVSGFQTIEQSSSQVVAPALTSSPRSRVIDDVQGTETTFLVTTQGAIKEDIDSRRQRPALVGSVEDLPPPPPPPPGF